MDTTALEHIINSMPSDDNREALLDGYRGVMLGLAAGNALGLPAEGESAHAIRRHFSGGITEVGPRERDRPWDDDLAQAALLAETLAESDELDPEVFAARLVEWAQRNGRGIGTLTRSVIAELEKGRPSQEAARLAWERNPMSNAGNGAVMRCPVVALRFLRSGDDLVRTARTSALVTHYDARCEWSTVVTAMATATCLSGTPAEAGDIAAALGAVGGEGWLGVSIEQVTEAARSVEGAALGALELDDPVDMGSRSRPCRSRCGVPHRRAGSKRPSWRSSTRGATRTPTEPSPGPLRGPGTVRRVSLRAGSTTSPAPRS